jgi:hypothetical protein
MADSFRCIAALNKAAGRELGADELQDVFDRIHAEARNLAAGRSEFSGEVDLSNPVGVMQKAAEIAAQKLIAEKVRQHRNVALQTEASAERRSNVEAMKAAGIKDVDAVTRLLANTADGKADQFSLEARVHGVSSLIKSRIQSTWEAMGGRFLGFIQDKDKIRALITEMKGQDSGDAMAKEGAKAWLNAAEETRQWFNDRGGDVGHLDGWGFPQHHSQERVAKAGKELWLADVYPALDLAKYVDDFGTRMSELDVKGLLSHAWDSIATNGANKIDPGKPAGFGARSNRHGEERQIHFKDADAVMGYWEKYGEKTFPDILLGHLETMAKDIAFLEHFGPNPDATFRMLRDQAEQSAKVVEPTSMARIDRDLARLDNLYNFAAGKTKPVADTRIAGLFDTIRNLNVAGKLGSAFWASLYGDKVMLEAVGRLNKLPWFQLQMNELRLLNPFNEGERRQLQRQTLMLDYMRSAMYRYGEDMGRSAWTGKLANGVMKLSGMSAVNEWRRGAFGLTMMSAIGHEVRTKAWADLGPNDARLLHSFGITEGDWGLWKLAGLEDYGHGNATMLTPEALAKIPDAAIVGAGLVPEGATSADIANVRRDAVVKYLGALHSESMNAVIEPTWAERARMVGGLQRGNLRDEITKSFWQFKGFSISTFSRMFELGLSRQSTGGKAGFISSLMMLQTLTGALMLQTQSLLSGEDPRPMDEWKFWAAAFLKGGSLGLYGDFLYSQSGTTRYGSGPLEALAGPAIGAAADTVTALVQAGNAQATGKDTHLGAKLLNIGKGFIPGGNLWYTRAAFDHILTQNAQEMLSPGYLANMRANSIKQYGQDWWWAPGQAVPDRAPNMANALGH